MNRVPPINIRRKLRKEVGFGCPVEGCGNPYLYWHHFDPPWKDKQHHNPRGMIALCAEHHAKADAGGFTTEQLRSLKTSKEGNSLVVKGQFDWRRRKLLGVVGGSFYYDTPVIIARAGEPILSFTRDSDGHILLNLKMLTTSSEERTLIEENFWILGGTPRDVECPPHGKTLAVHYSNGDKFRIEFFEINTPYDFEKRFGEPFLNTLTDRIPLTGVEIIYVVAGTTIEFGPRATKFSYVSMTNCWFENVQIPVFQLGNKELEDI